MTEDTRIGQRIAVLAVAAVLTGAPTSFAQAAQSALTARGAKSSAASARGSSSRADAAAYEKLNTGLVDEAAAGFQAVLAKQPDDPGALAGMGQVRILQGNYLAAISFLERARQASPDDTTIGAALDSARFQFLMGEGKDAQTAKDNEDAEKRYREALELQPDTPQAVSALVNVLVQESKLSDAQDVLSTAIANGASATGHPPAELEMQLGQLDIANSQPQLAYPIFLQVLEDSPERVDAWSGLISSLHLMGHDADAIAQEKAIPAGTRAQLDATPGFADMMAAMTSTSAQTAAASGPAYTPFVPAAETAPTVAATTPITTTSQSTTSAPAIAGTTVTTSANALTPAQASPTAAQTPAAAQPGSAPAAVRQDGSATPAAVPSAATVASVPPTSAPLTSSTPNSVTAQPSTPVPPAVPAVAPPVRKPVAPVQTARVPAAPEQTSTTSSPARTRGSALVSQPAKRPPERVEVPDTGDQQYPQPKARPRLPASTNTTSPTPEQN